MEAWKRVWGVNMCALKMEECNSLNGSIFGLWVFTEIWEEQIVWKSVGFRYSR